MAAEKGETLFYVDAEGNHMNGHTIVMSATSAGKTVLLAELAAQWERNQHGR